MHYGMTSNVARLVRKNITDISTLLLTEEDLNNDVLGFRDPTFGHTRPVDNMLNGPSLAYQSRVGIPTVHLPRGGWVTVVSPTFTATFRLPYPDGFVSDIREPMSEVPPKDHPHFRVPQRALRIVTDGAVFLVEGQPQSGCMEFGWDLDDGGDPRFVENWLQLVDLSENANLPPLKLIDGQYRYAFKITPDATRSPVTGQLSTSSSPAGWAQACVDEIRAFRIFASPTKRDGERYSLERCWSREMGNDKNSGPTATARWLASGVTTATRIVKLAHQSTGVSLTIRLEDI